LLNDSDLPEALEAGLRVIPLNTFVAEYRRTHAVGGTEQVEILAIEMKHGRLFRYWQLL